MRNTVIKTTALLVIGGILTKVETVTYPSIGEVVTRTYANPQDIVPSDIKWVKSPRALSPDQIIEHREVQLLNYWNNVQQ